MAKQLERDLGLYATITVSLGAMIGSGIFVLPGLAAKIAGPAVIHAYLLAGLLVLPAALSKAEMATAMPESGGTYLLLFAPGIAAQAKFVSLGLAALLVVVNVLGVKQSGRLKAVVVTLVLFALVLFIGNGLTFVDQPRYHPVFPTGSGGVLAATGFVFVSTSSHHLLYDVVFGAIPDRLAAELDCTVLMVHSNEPRRHTVLRYLLERVAF